MTRWGLMLCCVSFSWGLNAHADDGQSVRDAMLNALQHFNPASVLPGYTDNPKELQLMPQESNDALTQKGMEVVRNNDTAKEVYRDGQQRAHTPSSPETPEMRYAEQLLEHPEAALDEAVGCMGGQCDASKPELSDDIGEGVSRLGALVGVAQDVSNQQVRSGVAAIFSGSAYECKKHPLGIRDCCTDSGWGDWIKHCPKEMQELQRAKHENRAVYLGSYRRKKWHAHTYSFCVFPSKLAGIVQIQGRGGQLGIGFGAPRYPDCRGIKPEELERIRFDALDLSSIQQELVARMTPPQDGTVSSQTAAHIERLQQQGQSHD
ncbi:TPA: conjugal transfer protein TraN [Legionella pneumophila]|nr:conjugal transfer protein TraN [Legionella pneumophila]HCU5995180.1 conjugal transfer protein TraN [Legionella pneumophila]